MLHHQGRPCSQDLRGRVSAAADDVAIRGDPGAHEVKGVRGTTGAVGASLVSIPPHGPDLDPTGQAPAKLKAGLRAEALRTIDAPWQALGDIAGGTRQLLPTRRLFPASVEVARVYY